MDESYGFLMRPKGRPSGLSSIGLPPSPRWFAHDATESPVERCLRLVTDTNADFSETESALAQQTSRQMHSPAGEILHWRLSHQFDETLCKRRTRDCDLFRQLHAQKKNPPRLGESQFELIGNR